MAPSDFPDVPWTEADSQAFLERGQAHTPHGTRLILVEGIPGAGKSTTAQFLARRLERQGVRHRWWYEEELGHPVYVFHDAASLRRVVEELHSGDYRAVVAAALERWRHFAAAARRSDAVMILDGCLYGYLTWSLFPLDVPEATVRDYLRQVEAIIRPLDPRVIFLRQVDVAGALRRVCDRRGGSTEQRFISGATANPYAKRRGLRGFAGLAAYWTAYQALLDRAFAQSGLAKLAIDDAGGDWPAAYRRLQVFLGLPDAPAAPPLPDQPERFAGAYRAIGDAAGRRIGVRLAGGRLVLDGAAHVWPDTPLIPEAPLTFAVESLPLRATFVEDGAGAIDRLVLAGPALLDGATEGIYVRERDADAGAPDNASPAR